MYGPLLRLVPLTSPPEVTVVPEFCALNAAIAVENAHQAYAAAVESRNYQQQLLQAEIDKFAVGASTNFMIVQDQSYLAQARSTEVAARSDWMKARLSLDRALGNLLEKNNVLFDDTIRGRTR